MQSVNDRRLAILRAALGFLQLVPRAPELRPLDARRSAWAGGRSPDGHADGDPPDACPGLQPGPQRPEGTVVGRPGKPGEAECCSQEPAALVEHALVDDLVRSKQDCGIVRPSAFAVFKLDRALHRRRL